MKIKRVKPGNRSIIKRFAVFPVTVNYETRWLETVYIFRLRENGQRYLCGDFWSSTRFATKDEYLTYKKEVKYERQKSKTQKTD